MPYPLAKIDVQVSTLARPVTETLLAARTAIRVSPELQSIFANARAESWSAEALANALLSTIPEYLVDPTDLWETCRYLADEFMQMGDHTLLISAETGLAIARITSEDIYVPAPVSRETGGLAQPLPRMRPELEGLIVQWQFNRAHDQRTVQALASRLPSTELLATEGDNRLLQVTADGRRHIVDRVREALPSLLQNVGGTSGELLRLCKICTVDEVPASFLPCAPAMAFSRVIQPIVDPLAINLRHDAFTALSVKVGAEWVRDIARTLSGLVAAHRLPEPASVLDSLPGGLWIAEPNTAMALRGKRVLPVAGSTTTLIYDWAVDPVACLVVSPASYECRAREFLGRWEVAAAMEFTLHLNLFAFATYQLKDVPDSGISVEVVS